MGHVSNVPSTFTISGRQASFNPSITSSLVRRSRANRITCAASMHGMRLAGVGSSVPEKVLTNLDLEKLVETNDEWITTRTGIKQRHVLSEGETLSGHAAAASQRALDMAGASIITFKCTPYFTALFCRRRQILLHTINKPLFKTL